MAFDADKWTRARQKTTDRLNLYRGLTTADNPDLHTAVQAFYSQLWYEGHEINAGRQPQGNQQVVNDLVRELDKAGGFSVRADWWAANQNLPQYSDATVWQTVFWDAADVQAQNTGLWSKTTGMPAEVRATILNGKTLEGCPAATAFDDNHPGFDRATPSPSLNLLWGDQSHAVASKARGTVQVDVLRGIDEGSVLKNVEMPVLLDMMDRGAIDGVTFHVRRRNQQSKVLEEVATYTISSRESYDQVPTLDRTPSYFAEQNQEYKTQQVARAILRNRQGVQQSLDGFRQILDNAKGASDQVVVMTGLDTRLSSKLKASSDDLKGWNHRSKEAVKKGTSATTTLQRKLEHLARQQDARASSSSSSSSSSKTSPKAAKSSHRSKASSKTPSTSSSRGSGDPLAPVNTAASGEHVYMSNPRGHLPAGGQMPLQQPEFRTPQYQPVNPLTRAMTNLTIAPDDTRYSQGSHYPPAPTQPSVSTSSWKLSEPVGNYTATTGGAANPTGDYYGNHGNSRQYSTSTSSSGSFGEPLTRVNHAPSHSPSPPPAAHGR